MLISANAVSANFRVADQNQAAGAADATRALRSAYFHDALALLRSTDQVEDRLRASQFRHPARRKWYGRKRNPIDSLSCCRKRQGLTLSRSAEGARRHDNRPLFDNRIMPKPAYRAC